MNVQLDPELLARAERAAAANGVASVSGNADQALAVSFEPRANKLNARSAEEGRDIFEERIHVVIRIPGTKDVIDRPVTDADKARFPLQWARFVNTKSTAVDGTPLEYVPFLNVAQIATLKALNIFSLEQAAVANDQVIMKFGPGGREIKDKCEAYIQAAKDSAIATKQADEINSLKAQIAELRDELHEKKGKVKEKGRP